MGSQRVGHHWASFTFTVTIPIKGKRSDLPISLIGMPRKQELSGQGPALSFLPFSPNLLGWTDLKTSTFPPLNRQEVACSLEREPQPVMVQQRCRWTQYRHKGFGHQLGYRARLWLLSGLLVISWDTDLLSFPWFQTQEGRRKGCYLLPILENSIYVNSNCLL